jgi:Leucine-rich repeat (LRR) protein
LRNNSLDDIEDEAFALLTLDHLDLSSNNLEDAKFLKALNELAYLNLTFNEFQEIDTALLGSTETDFWGEQDFLFWICSDFLILNKPSLGNPFICEWLVTEGLAAKRLRLGVNYIVNSTRNVLKAEGILCFDEEGMEERRLIVVESKEEKLKDEVSKIGLFAKFALFTAMFADWKSSRIPAQLKERLESGSWRQLWLQVNLALAFMRLPWSVYWSPDP